MTERLPYEEQLAQQWNDLPLPDENRAWADMRRRLDEEDNRRVPPFWLRGCAGWGLLGLLLLGLGWWIIRPEKWFNKKQDQPKEMIKTVSNKIDAQGDSSAIAKGKEYNYDDSTGTSKIGGPILIDTNSTLLINNARSIDTVQLKQKPLKVKPVSPTLVVKEPQQPARSKERTKSKEIKSPIVKTETVKTRKPIAENIKEKEMVDSGSALVKTKDKMIDPVPVIGSIKKSTDSVRLVKIDPVIKKEKQDTVVQPVAKKDSTKKKSFSFSAGIALHQQLPIDSQGYVPYNAVGRKGSLRDYIPSIYIRLNRDQKWFVQAGFRYGAPQLTKQFLYSNKIDTISPQKINITSSYLKKTFYHQLPLTFNYFIVPKLSLGGGVIWNNFAGAVSTRNIVQRDRFTGNDTVQSTGEIFSTRGADSNFRKSYFQATIETQYKWKRLSIGANYSFGLQPYIRFVLPGGQTQEQKNKALQVFIRYELWRSKKGK